MREIIRNYATLDYAMEGVFVWGLLTFLWIFDKIEERNEGAY